MEETYTRREGAGQKRPRICRKVREGGQCRTQVGQVAENRQGRRICAVFRLPASQGVSHVGVRHRHRLPDVEYLPHGTDIQPPADRADGHGHAAPGRAAETET